MLEKVFVVIPAYNAAKTVALVFDRIPPEFSPRIRRYVAVDDGSTDNTFEVLSELKQRLPNLTLLRHDINRGYGAAEKTLLLHALENGADAAVLLHADGQYSPEMMPALLKPLDDGQADLVQGSRLLGGGALKGGMPLYKYAANRGLTLIENLAFGLNMAEYHSGYMLYSRRFLEMTPFTRLSDSFDFDLEMIVAARVLGLRIREVAIPTIYADEESHLHPIKYGLDVLTVVVRYRRGYYHRLLGADAAGGRG